MLEESQSTLTHDTLASERAPDELYHYTTVEALASILKSRTFRLQPLDRMDDLQEREGADLKHAGRLVFVSCWTDDKEESIPMWNMYSSLRGGVRISLPPNPFKWFDIDVSEIARRLNSRFEQTADAPGLRSLLPLDELMHTNYFSPAILWYMNNSEPSILRRVQYTSDRDKLYPTLMSHNPDSTTLWYDSLGSYKNKSWEFQREWRYRMAVHPGANIFNPDFWAAMPFGIIQVSQNIIRDDIKIPIGHLTLHLAEEALSQMVIVTSPKLSDGNRIILDQIRNAFAPHICIHSSKLEGLL
jgi:hypothetical protein